MLLAGLTGVQAANDVVSLTFERTGTDAGSVTVNSSATDVTAEFVSLTGAATSFKASTGTYLTNAVLCPDKNANASQNARVLTFKVNGLSAITKIGVTVLGLNNGGGYQNQDNYDRTHTISCAASSSADGTPVVLKTFEQNLTKQGGDAKFDLMADELDATYQANGNEPIYLTLTITPKTNTGCFFGLSEVKLGTVATEPEPEPEPEPTEHTFDANKVYYIQWKNTGDANHVTQSGTSLVVAAKSIGKYQFWKFIPTDKANCYYIQNVVSEKYIGSCNMEPSPASKVTVSDTPVEYYVGKTAATTGDNAGCYYMSSTDCTNYGDETKSPCALNKDGASSNIITWTAGTKDDGSYKTGSYWKIVETTDEYQHPEPPTHTDAAKDLVVYFNPCGMAGNTYLKGATVNGIDPIAYSASGKPGNYHVPYSKDRGAVVRGSEFTIGITLSAAPGEDLKANAYFDWDADGSFEATAPIALDGVAGTAKVTAPDDAVSGDTRMRIRLNSNGLDHADDDVEGFVYDFHLAVIDASAQRKVTVAANDNDRGSAALSSVADTYTVGTQLTATATPKDNAEFHSWRENGVVVSREAAYTFTVENRNMTLKAYFTTADYAAEEDIATAKEHLRTGIGCPKTTSAEYIALDGLTVEDGKTLQEVEAIVAAYLACADIELPEAGKYYRLVSAATGSVSRGENVTMVVDRTDGKVEWKTFADGNLDADIDNLWQFEAAEGGRYKLKAANGGYVGEVAAGSAPTALVDEADAGSYALGTYAPGICKLSHSDDGQIQHLWADGNHIICGWENGKTSNSAWYILPADKYEITINSGYASICLPFAVQPAAGVTAYAIESTNSTRAILAEKADIPAGEGAILEGQGTVKLNLTTAASDWGSNMLKGTFVDSYVQGAAYVLAKKNDVIGLYKASLNKNEAGEAGNTHFKNNANKAYLVVEGSNAPMFSLDRGEGTTEIENSKLKIENSVIYDLQGCFVEKTEKGIYIVNGRKVVIK